VAATVLLLVVPLYSAWSTSAAETNESPPPTVITVHRPEFRSYGEVAAEFRARLRMDVRTVSLRPGNRAAILGYLRQTRPRLLFAVGQSAYDLTREASAGPTISTYVFEPCLRPPYAVGHVVHPRHIIDAVRRYLPEKHKLGVLVGQGAAAARLLRAARLGANRTGATIIALRATTPEGALQMLRRRSADTDALWLAPDPDTLSPQVVGYAIALQYRRHIAVIGATRQHATAGALLALDYPPVRLGRHAATAATRLLARPLKRLAHAALQLQPGPCYGASSPRTTINRTAAARLGVATERFGDGINVVE
jgi:hypothetical protein